MRILHPESQEEKAQAIREAAAEPALFQMLADKFPGKMPAEEVLRNFLIRDGFAPAAVPAVILAYRDTNEFVERESGAYDSPGPTPVEAPMQPTSLTPAAKTGLANIVQALGNNSIIDGKQRLIASYPFESGGALEIRVVGDIGTEEALDMAETLIELKRKEIARNAKKAPLPKDQEDDLI
jgi:hypothetical protein